ncbi:MAG: beta-lactamase family protein [Candidatus Marinimicrobia bacterium]|nr:beta-lactamase family protein [Candidatus Neomarinimicrobiota bacterium]
MKKTHIALAALILLTLSPLAGNSKFVGKNPQVAEAIELLEIWIDEQMTHQQLPSLTLGIVYDQELIWAKGYGFADVEKRTPATPQTLYRIASITKTFTSTAIMQLRDAGKLRLDDPVTKYLPWFEPVNPFDEAKEVTVWHLLTHTAGLPREAAFPYWTDHKFPTLEQIKTALPSQTLLYPPGTTYKYSNLGMSLLGAVVAAAAGEPWEQYVTKNILEPLGMTSSAVIPSEEHRSASATAYDRRMPDNSRQVDYYPVTNGIAPAASIASNIEDMAKYAMLQFREGPAAGKQILKGSSLAEMHRCQFVYGSWSGGRGLGFGLTNRDGKTIVSHGGWVSSYRTHFMFNPKEKIAVIAMAGAADCAPFDYSYEAYDLVGPAIVDAVTPETKPSKPEKVWQKYVGRYEDGSGWEYRVLIHDNRLVLYDFSYPPRDDATSNLTYLTPVGKHTFKMSDGEPVIFELGKDGKVGRVQRGCNYIYPLE